MDKGTVFLKISSYILGAGLCIAIVPLQYYLHKNHNFCAEGFCHFCHIFWHILQITIQFIGGSVLIFYAKND